MLAKQIQSGSLAASLNKRQRLEDWLGNLEAEHKRLKVEKLSECFSLINFYSIKVAQENDFLGIDAL